MANTPAERVWKGDSEASINNVNQWMRSQPWYQQQLQQWGQNPASVHLSDAQRQQIVKLAQANGAVVDQGNIEVDPSGNFNPIGHKLRNTLIAAGIAGAALTGGAALGAFGGAAGAGGAGAAGAGAGAAGAAGAGGALGATTIGSGFIPAIAGGAGISSAGIGAGAAAGGSGILGTAGHFLGGTRNILGAAGEVSGALESGRAQGRIDEAAINQRQDANAINAAQVNLGAGAKRGQQAVRGDILANAKDFSYGAPTMVGNIPVPTSTGGLRPSIFSNTTRQLGGQLSSDALAAQADDHGNPAQLTPLPQAGATDSILNTVATIGGVSDFLGKIPYRRLVGA